MTPLVLLLLAPVLVDVVRRPTFRNLALRNISRRRGEAVLVIVGSLLGTAIITASLVVGDTVEGSIRDGARTGLGPIDEVVRLDDPAQLAAVATAVSEPPVPDVDGVLTLRAAGVVTASRGPDRRAEPTAAMVEVDFDRARAFGPDPAIGGLAGAGATPAGDEAVLGRRMATTLGVATGDPVELFAGGTSRVLRVRDVVDDVGLAGYAPVRSSRVSPERPTVVFVAPGTIDAMFAGGPAAPGAEAPTNEVLVSNTGGVFDGADHSDAVEAELKARTAGVAGAQVATVKATVLEQARVQGASLTDLFRSIGYFSVIAGVLLLVNLFVMLSEERRSELGTLRALGFKRNNLVRTFAIEGAVYSVAASVLGAVTGIGVGWAIVRATAGIFSRGSIALDLALVIKPSSLLAGASLGLVICMVTVWGTSARIARLNIIRSIRELPEPNVGRRSLRSLVLGAAVTVVGVLALVSGWGAGNAAAIIAGPAVAAFGLIFVAGRYLPRKPVTVVLSLAALAWGIGVFTLAPDKVGNTGIDVFVVQGIVLVSAGVVALAQADRLWAALATGASAGRGGLAARLGLAYPLARKFRTALLLGMYSIVIFTMAFISVLSGIFADQAPRLAADGRAGFDIVVDSNQGNPVTAGQLTGQPGVAAVAPLTRAVARARTPRRTDGANVALTGFDRSLLAAGQPALESRGSAWAGDAEVFRAVLADPGLIVVSQSFAARSQGGGPPQQNLSPGDRVTLQGADGAAPRELTVAGVLRSDFVGTGALVSDDALAEVVGPRKVVNRHYVSVAPGADAEAVAAAITGSAVENGASARTFVGIVEEQLETQTGFFALLRGYLGLGLLIGIAGLGVVMVRAVRERRREIGMLRAIGVPAPLVRRAFVLEAAFITLQGILLGVGLGMLTSYNLLANSDAFGDQQLDFSWPWTVLAIIAVAPLVASMLATSWPASQAARIRPAVALRIAD